MIDTENVCELVPWPAVMQELSLARSLAEFASSFEALTVQLCQAEQALYYALRVAGEGPGGVNQGRPDSEAPARMTSRPPRAEAHELYRPAQPDTALPCNEGNLVGASLLNCEILHFPAERLSLPPEHVDVTAAVAVPVKLYGRPLGSLLIINAADPLSDEDLADLGNVASLALESVERFEDLTAFTRQAEELMVRSVEGITGEGHLSRVAQLASEIAKLMDLSALTRQRLWRAALYHDVGLLFPGGPESHPQNGAQYLSRTRFLADLAPLVASHHERYDGSGWPAGLKGDQASVDCWVLALAEHLEEFRSEHQAAPVTSIVEEFFAGPAHSHHPAAVDALGGLLVSGRLEQLLVQSQPK